MGWVSRGMVASLAGKRERGETFTSLHQRGARVASDREDRMTAWQAQAVRETKQYDTVVTQGA